MADTTCMWYVKEEEAGDYERCFDDKGFCLCKDLYTPCGGSRGCPDFCKDSFEMEKDE